MSKLETLKEKLQKAKDEYTRATAVMGEVKANIAKEIITLKELGVEFEDIKDGEDEGEYYGRIQEVASKFVEKIEAEIEEMTRDIEDIVNKWED